MSHNELITLLVFAAVVILLAVIGSNDRRRRRKNGSVLSGMSGTFDEAFHPEAARATEIREVQREIPAETSTPRDLWELDGTYVLTIHPAPPNSVAQASRQASASARRGRAE